jgi:hypothetical protein
VRRAAAAISSSVWPGCPVDGYRRADYAER